MSNCKKAWIYGDGGFAHLLKIFLSEQDIEVIGTITKNFFKLGNTNGGPELYKSNKYPVFIGVFNHRDDPVDILEYLESIDAVKVFTPADVCIAFQNLGFSKYYLSTDLNQVNTDDDLSKVISYLSDDKSRDVFEGFVSYQKTGNLRRLIRSAPASIQYLGKTLPSPYRELWMTHEIHWLDIGAFDGDTLRDIKKSGRNMIKDEYVCIEPDVKNFENLTNLTLSWELKIKLFNFAVGEKPGMIDFLHQGGLNSSIQEDESRLSSESAVEVRTIDQVCKEFIPTHIKMDIEGAEMSALIGGGETLMHSRPKLAISIYHRPGDIVQIPLYLMRLLPDYNWFIRCYGAHGYDTILYGLPN